MLAIYALNGSRLQARRLAALARRRGGAGTQKELFTCSADGTLNNVIDFFLSNFEKHLFTALDFDRFVPDIEHS